MDSGGNAPGARPANLVFCSGDAQPLMAPISEPINYCTSSRPAATLCVDLKGWPEGTMTWAEWLDIGGPLDATDHLPAGGGRNHDLSFTTLQRFSVQRPGALA